MKSIISPNIFGLVAILLSLYPADAFTAAEPGLAKVVNGNFEHGPLAPAWVPSISGNASVVRAKQPGNKSNHVARVTLHCNPCACDDDNCCSASLSGTILRAVPGANYTVTWDFMYALDVGDVYWFADVSRCDASGCGVASFENVQYPQSAQAYTWEAYSASFTAPAIAAHGNLSLDVYPGGCKTGHTFMDNFSISRSP